MPQESELLRSLIGWQRLCRERSESVFPMPQESEPLRSLIGWQRLCRERSESLADAGVSLGLIITYLSTKTKYADLAELADAYGSGPYESDFMQVRPLLSAPS